MDSGVERLVVRGLEACDTGATLPAMTGREHSARVGLFWVVKVGIQVTEPRNTDELARVPVRPELGVELLNSAQDAVGERVVHSTKPKTH